MRVPVRDSCPRQARIDNQAGSSASTPVVPRRARRPLQGARAAGPLGARTPGHHSYVSGSSFGQGTNRKCPVVAEGGACLEQLVPREAGPAKMIQAILVFNNHGKPRLVRFYQRFVSAARPVTHPRPFPSPRRAAALASTSGSGTVHDPPPHPPGDPALLCSDTFPWVLGQTRYTVCLTGILDDKNHCL